MSGFKEQLKAYGADYEATMERFMGNEGLYMRLLDMLFKDESLHKLGEAIDAGDMTPAFEAAHTLKGVVGNMGLKPLYEAVCDIVEPLRQREEREDYAMLYKVVQDEFQKADELRHRLKGEGSNE